MNETGVKHTPGPWLAVSGDDVVNFKPPGCSQMQPHRIVNRIVGGENNNIIVGYTGMNYPLCETNARLIAATPEILELLKLYTAAYKRRGYAPHDAECDCYLCCETARLVAEIEGREENIDSGH